MTFCGAVTFASLKQAALSALAFLERGNNIMKRIIQKSFEHRLLGIREQLGSERTRLSDSILSAIGPVGEHDGCVSESIDKELSLEHTEEELCQSVDDALARLAKGTFGMCIHCGKEIPLRRLEALPFTSYCIDCEYEWERERGAKRAELAPRRRLVH
jgi:RNA polymerase-binding protein DksA